MLPTPIPTANNRIRLLAEPSRGRCYDLAADVSRTVLPNLPEKMAKSAAWQSSQLAQDDATDATLKNRELRSDRSVLRMGRREAASESPN